MKINAWFQRTTCGKRVENKSIVGIDLDDNLARDSDDDSAEIRRQLREHAPVGDGWNLEGYCRIVDAEKVNE